MTFNAEQLRAIQSDWPHIVVAAGPGAGKSSTLIARVVHRVKNGTDPKRILLLTFTQAGARVFTERLAQHGITVGYAGTLHGWLYGLLNRYGETIGYRSGGITLITEEDAETMLLTAAERLGWTGSAKQLKEAKKPLAQLAWKEFHHQLRRNNSVTYDLVLTEGARLLAHVAHRLNIDELLIDEAQDSAEIDWEIYEAIPARNRFIVGDLDQSIFGFRGAHPEGFMKESSRCETETIRLQTNYRSGQKICAAATNLIRNNVLRIDKAVIAAHDALDDRIEVWRYDTDLVERSRVSGSVSALVASDHDPSEIAILLRTNALASKFREALAAAGVPVAETETTQRPPDWSAMLDVLNMWLDPRNDLIAAKVLKRLVPDALPSLKQIALRDGIWLSGAATEHCRSSLPMIPKDASVEAACAALPQWRIGVEAVALARDTMATLTQPEPTLANLVHELWQSEATARQVRPGVHVSTIHAAKGMEFDVVFCPALEQEDWPGTRDNVEESRRLFFVAVTRARRELYISHCSSRRTEWNGTQDRTPSIFISELGLPSSRS